MQLTGIHHVTAVTAAAARNHAFYTGTLGMRLVKKTVNQDDVSAYHLFYADGEGSPGTDLTFFDWPSKRETRGTRSIVSTGLRVTGEDSLGWWADRLRSAGLSPGPIAERDGRASLDFEDPEGQRLRLVDDCGSGPPPRPWDSSPVPARHQIRGLGPVAISVPKLGPTQAVLSGLMAMRALRRFRDEEGRDVAVFGMDGGGPAAELQVIAEPGRPAARPGAGGVHHVAFRCPDADYDAWAERLAAAGSGVRSSGPVDRFYFRSLYFREPGGVLFEIATDGPGFGADEPRESLGERLALPPFLEARRAEIETGLKPLATGP